MKRWMMWPAAAISMIPFTAKADPLDSGEAYTTRTGTPEWMTTGDFAWLVAEYGMFALMLIGLGWLLFKRPSLFITIESALKAPFSAMFSAAREVGGLGEIVLQLIATFAAFIAIAAWVFFCQWLKSIGLGPVSMLGLALLALMLVRMIKAGEERTATACD